MKPCHKVRWIFVCFLLLVIACVSRPPIQVSVPEDPGAVPPYAIELLQERLTHLADHEVVVSRDLQDDITGKQKDVFIRLRLEPDMTENLDPEGYRIEINPKGVKISAGQPNGLMFGVAHFLEWLIGETSPHLYDKENVDIDFPTERGQAAELLRKLPSVVINDQPFYSLRGAELQILALGVADLIETDKGVERYYDYAGIEGGYKQSPEVWKRWCDWLARHRMNFITNWPYSAGTNWWELVNHPDTQGMSIYDKSEIEKAADIREELLHYARTRGLEPYLMNYVPGGPTDTIVNNYPEIIGGQMHPDWPPCFDLSKAKTTELFETQIKAITRRYPSLAGFHFRWWGYESCISPDDDPDTMLDLTHHMMVAAQEERDDCSFIMSGFYRGGGTLEFAKKLPEHTAIQSKWYNDWEPLPEPVVPPEHIRQVPHQYLISHNLPGEEFHPIGGVQYRSLEAGIKKYSRARGRMPNLAGFATVCGEEDFGWITEVNYQAMAHLNWAPLSYDGEKFVKNYLVTHYGPEAVKLTFRALELTQDAMEDFVIDFGGIAPYIDCARLHWMFGLERVKKLNTEQLEKGIGHYNTYVEKLEKAYRLLDGVQDRVISRGQQSFKDLLIQTRWYADFLVSRRLLARAFLAKKQGRPEEMVETLKQLKDMNRALVDLALSKPNISDDFEFEGLQKATPIRQGVQEEIKEINELLANMD
jgi:hypothetical protein